MISRNLDVTIMLFIADCKGHDRQVVLSGVSLASGAQLFLYPLIGDLQLQFSHVCQYSGILYSRTFIACGSQHNIILDTTWSQTISVAFFWHPSISHIDVSVSVLMSLFPLSLSSLYYVVHSNPWRFWWVNFVFVHYVC